jgi:hypothetical protein
MKSHLILVSLIIALLAGTAANAKYSGGTGEPNDPYRIATPEDLNDIGNYEEDWDKHFILVNDVNLAQYTGTQFNIIGKWFDWDDPNNKPFTGVFDGNDHKVWSFTWDSNGINLVGLFKYVGEGGQIKNLCLESVDVNAINGSHVGGLVGWNEWGTITNCHSTSSVSGDSGVGGLVGSNMWGTITNCYSTGSVTGGMYYVGGLVGKSYKGTITICYYSGKVSGSGTGVGGLVGRNYESTITDCYSETSALGIFYVGGLVGHNDGTITDCYSTGKVSGYEVVGGLVGYNYEGTITACYFSGSVSGTLNFIGGLVGRNGEKLNSARIYNCYSTGTVSGGEVLGGLVGWNYNNTITNCYSTASVSGDGFTVGGLVGSNSYSGSEITNCYSTGKVLGRGRVGGLCGGNSGHITSCFWDIQTSDCNTSDGGEGKTTAEMKTKSTFTDAGWDFVGETINGPNDVWRMCVDGVDYPLLSWQLVPDFVCLDGVDFFDLEFLVESWLRNCDYFNNFCNYVDINYNGLVNFDDFAILASHWLE